MHQPKKSYKPYTICMNQKFTSDGYNAYVFQSISLYTQIIHTSDYQNYIDQSKIYPNMEKLQQGMLYQLKINNPKVLICICMYNQPRQALQNTLKGIYANLKQLQQQQNISSQQIGVFLIQDGILKSDDSIIQFYQGIDRESRNESNSGFSICSLKQRMEVIKQEISSGQKLQRSKQIAQNNNFPETIPKRLSLLYQNKWRPDTSNNIYMNLFSCFKHLNGTKLSSHAWFFQGFCQFLNPQFCVLLDVGTVPDSDGIVNLIKGLKQNQNIGGVSGFMGIDTEFISYEGQNKKKNLQKDFNNIFNQNDKMKKPLIQMINLKSPRQSQRQSIRFHKSTENSVAKMTQQSQQKLPQENKSQFLEFMIKSFLSIQKAQEVEYIYAHFFDKNSQSFTKFLHVLPGAWSGYRLKALKTGQKFEKDLLQEKYFKTINEKNKSKQKTQSDYKFANMYLAEDRILSLGIYCQKEKQSGYYLKYIPNAKAKTDSMTSHYDLVTQRRRWINSSYFAFKYVLQNYEFDFQNSKHGLRDYILLKINMFLASCSFFNAYFIPCFYLFILYSTIRQNIWIPFQQLKNYLALFLSLLYIATVVVCIGGSLNGVDWIKQIYEKDEYGNILRNQNGQYKRHVKPKNGPAVYITFIMTFFTYLLLIALTSIVVQVIKNSITNYNDSDNKMFLTTILIVIIINIGFFFIIVFMHIFTHPIQVFKLIIGYPSYITYQGLYTHTMLIYSFCNVDDVSWGTKGASKAHQKSRDLTRDKIQFLASWIFWNSLVCFGLFLINLAGERTAILMALSIYSSIITALKSIFAIINHIQFYLFDCCRSKK